MSIAPVSGDFLLKAALIAGGIGLAVILVRRSGAAVGQAVQSAVQGVTEIADAVIVGTSPTNPDNWANRAVAAAGSAVTSASGPGRNADGSWTLGGAIYDLFHADPLGQMVFPPRAIDLDEAYSHGGPSTGVYGVATNTGGATGTW